MTPVESIPLSALQHYLYCPRQCALIHVEREWAESFSTAEGRVLHEKVDSGKGESRPGVRITRALPVHSERHGLHGVCDVVELHRNGAVRPKAHRADEVQLCAQAICLEETLGLAEGAIADGHLFYGKTQRRKLVALDAELRTLVLTTSTEIRKMLAARQTPPATYSAKLCDRCSLLPVCQPKAMRLKRGVAKWFQAQLAEPT